MIKTIKVINPNGTYLKIDPMKQSLDPENHDKVFLSYNSLLKVSNIEPLSDNYNGHQLATLAEYDATYWLYSKHWNYHNSDTITNTTTNTTNTTTNINTTTNNTETPATQKKGSVLFINQLDKLNKYAKNGVANLDTKADYYTQRDNYTMPHRTCNSSSNAMYLNWLRKATGSTTLAGDDNYLKTVLKHGDTIYHESQTAALLDYGFKTTWMTDGNGSLWRELLLAGIPIPINILHRGTVSNPRGGHIIMLIGYRQTEKAWIAHDPYGTLSSGYTDPNGAYSFISDRDLQARSQGGYRILC